MKKWRRRKRKENKEGGSEKVGEWEHGVSRVSGMEEEAG